MTAALRVRLLLAAATTLGASAANAAITSEGDVSIIRGNPAASVLVGIQQDGTLTITPPDVLVTQSLTVAESAGVVGAVDLNSGGLTVNTRSNIGAGGVGELTVRGGGAFTQTTGATAIGGGTLGALRVTGPDSVADLGGETYVASDQFGGDFSAPRGEIAVTDGGELRTRAAMFGPSPFNFGGAGSADVLIEGAGSTWFQSGDTSLTNTTLTVRDGGRVIDLSQEFEQTSLSLGANTTTHVSGAGSSILASEIRLGESGQAVMRVDQGADVVASTLSLAGSPFGSSIEFPPSAVLEVDGLGTTLVTNNLFLSGPNGSATLRITDGATVVDTNPASNGLSLAPALGSSALVTIDGPTSRLTSTNGLLTLGGQGRGELRILGGAYHENERVDFGLTGPGEGHATVSGQGSLWNVRDGLWINDGRLTINDSGAVQLPFQSRVEPRGEIALNGGAILGRLGDSGITNLGVIRGHGEIGAVIDNQQGGLVRVGSGQTLAVDRISGIGDVEVDGGVLRAESLMPAGQTDLRDATLIVGDSLSTDFDILLRGGEFRFLGGDNLVEGQVVFRGGEIVATGDSRVTFADEASIGFGAMVVNEGASVTFLDDFSGGAVLGGGELRFEGEVVTPLTSLDIGFDVDAQFTATASLQISLNQLDANAFVTDGDVDLGGELLLDVFNEIQTPGIHDITVVEAAALTDEFDFLPELGSFIGPRTRFLGIDYTATSAVVTVEQLAPGDANGDGVVDGDDLAVWADQHGAGPATLSPADANGDGAVNAADYALIRAAMGPGDEVPIPEPTPLALLTACLATAVARRRREATVRGEDPRHQARAWSS